MLGEDIVEHAEHALGLILVAFDCAGYILGSQKLVPAQLAEVRALARRLEEQPLQLSASLVSGNGDLVLGVVFVDDVENDCV